MRKNFFQWRKDTVDMTYGWLSQHEDYEQNVENAVFDIVGLYQGHIKAPYSNGDRYNWDTTIYRTTELVAFAADLGIRMRRSKDGTWSPFIPVRGITVREEAIMRHQDTDASFPAGQTQVRPDGKSKVAMTVVPGLSKYQMQDAPEDPAQPGVKMAQTFKIIRMKAKCLIDLEEADTGPMLDGDIWEPDDL